MEIISHRRNTVTQLMQTPTEFGVEVDIRSRGDALIIHHDPFAPGEPFEEWIASYRHGTLILNVKEEGLEDRLLVSMKQHGISDFFFLDQSFPFLIRTARKGERRCAVRVSEYESLDTALTLAGKIDWVWIDYFTRFPLNEGSANRLRQTGFKLCLVSPELQGYSEDHILALRRHLKDTGIVADAVCTKVPSAWQ